MPATLSCSPLSFAGSAVVRTENDTRTGSATDVVGNLNKLSNTSETRSVPGQALTASLSLLGAGSPPPAEKKFDFPGFYAALRGSGEVNVRDFGDIVFSVDSGPGNGERLPSENHEHLLPSVRKEHGDAINRVSSAFLGTPYQANTLIGGASISEELVANFNGVDCFTFLDYVEALFRSHDQTSFRDNLVRIRYAEGKVDFLSRRHFFSDWFATAPGNALDVTPEISPQYKVVEKQLNFKSEGEQYISGLGIQSRKIHYIPRDKLDQQVLSCLKTGDYVGVYSPLEGLDVSHVGIVIHEDPQVWFRHASFNNEVVDSPFLEYMKNKPGIVVLRSQ
jgi:hypothetical protein